LQSPCPGIIIIAALSAHEACAQPSIKTDEKENKEIQMFRKLLMVGMLAFTGAAWSQAYPTKPIRMIVPFPPGGSTDLVARHLAQRLTTELGQAVVIDNRGGANGIVGAQAAMQSAPDGYTIFLAASSVMGINPVLYSKLPYDPLKSFAQVSMLTMQPLLIAVNNDLPVNTLNEFIALAKAKPGKLNFAGVGTSTSLPFFYLENLAGFKVQEVPYSGGGPGLTALIGGQVESIVFTLGTVYPQVQAKKLKPLAVTSAKRSTLAPEIPTVAESGFPGFDASVWNGLSVPAGTPRDIIDRLNKATIAAMQAPEVKEQFTKAGIEIATSTPEKFEEFIRGEIARWGQVARAANIKPQ